MEILTQVAFWLLAWFVVSVPAGLLTAQLLKARRSRRTPLPQRDEAAILADLGREMAAVLEDQGRMSPGLYRIQRLQAPAGGIEGSIQQIAGLEQPIRSAPRECLAALEELAITMPTGSRSGPGIEDALKANRGWPLLSTTLSGVGRRLWKHAENRDLAQGDIVYLLVEGIAGPSGPGQRHQPVLAWGLTLDGRKLLLHLMTASNEDAQTLSALFSYRHRIRPSSRA